MRHSEIALAVVATLLLARTSLADATRAQVTFSTGVVSAGTCLTGCVGGDEANQDSYVPTNGRLSHLYVHCPGATGGTYTIKKNHVSTGLACTIVSGTCAKTDVEVDYDAGDLIDLGTGINQRCLATVMVSENLNTAGTHNAIFQASKATGNPDFANCAQTDVASMGCGAPSVPRVDWIRAPSAGNFAAISCCHESTMIGGRSSTYQVEDLTTGFGANLTVTCDSGSRFNRDDTCTTHCDFNVGDKIAVLHTFVIGQLKSRGLWVEATGVPQTESAGVIDNFVGSETLYCNTNSACQVGSVSARAPHAMTLQKLYVDMQGTSTAPYVFTVWTGNTASLTASALTCTIEIGETACTNLGSSVTIAEGDYYNLQFTAQASHLGIGFTYEMSEALPPTPTPTVTDTPTITPTMGAPPDSCCDCGAGANCQDPVAGLCPTPCTICTGPCFCLPVATDTPTITATSTQTPTVTRTSVPITPAGFMLVVPAPTSTPTQTPTITDTPTSTDTPTETPTVTP